VIVTFINGLFGHARGTTDENNENKLSSLWSYTSIPQTSSWHGA